MLAFRSKRDAIRDNWFRFDSFLLLTMMLETWLLGPLQKLLNDMRLPVTVAPLRLFRMVRLTRLARVVRNVPELVTMALGLLQGARACAASIVMIIMLIYIFGISLHALLKEEHDLNQRIKNSYNVNFATLLDCMWILLIDGTFMLDGTGDILTMLSYEKKANCIVATLILLSFLFLAAMVICNMLIGVLCEVVTQVAQRERDSKAIRLLKETMLIHLKQYDGGDGKISKDQLKEVMSEKSSRELLDHLNIDTVFMLALQKMLYTKHDTLIPIKGVMELMLTCRGDTPATVHTIANCLSYLSSRLDKLDLHLKDHAASIYSMTHGHAPLERSTKSLSRQSLSSATGDQLSTELLRVTVRPD